MRLTSVRRTQIGYEVNEMNSMVMHWVQSGGYIGVFLAMVLESACIPLPSEVVMPFGGYLAFRGHLHLGIVILMGVLGNVVGSLISYYVGKFGGRAVIRRYGRYVRLSERHMDAAERWFRRRGDWVVFVGRLLPAIRTFISLPAGIAKMNAVKFTAYSAAGSCRGLLCWGMLDISSGKIGIA